MLTTNNSDISNTYEDPLARSVRRRLRANKVPSGIPVVYSTEVPGEVKLLPLPDTEFESGNISHLQPFDDFRVRILPVLGPLPAIFGLNIATYILLDLSAIPRAADATTTTTTNNYDKEAGASNNGKPGPAPDFGHPDYLEVKNRKRLYDSLYRALSEREARWQGLALQAKLSINVEDVAFVFEDLYHGRASLPPHGVLAKPALVRWDRARELAEDNIVVMSAKDATIHEKECLKEGRGLVDVWGGEAVDLVKRKSDEARRTMIYRRW
jgi:hypothetical protein